MSGEALAHSYEFAIHHFGPKQLGNAKVKHLGISVGIHHDIRRFQIAMNDEMLMQVLDGTADF